MSLKNSHTQHRSRGQLTSRLLDLLRRTQRSLESNVTLLSDPLGRSWQGTVGMSLCWRLRTLKTNNTNLLLIGPTYSLNSQN